MKKIYSILRQIQTKGLSAFILLFVSIIFLSYGNAFTFAQTEGDGTTPPGDGTTIPPDTTTVPSDTTVTTTVAVPSSPASLHATPNMCGSGTIYLSWPSVTGATGYRLSRDGAVINDGTGLSYPDSRLTTGSSHSYSLVAYNSAGSSAVVTADSSAPPSCVTVTRPTAPSGLMVDGTPAIASVKLKWTDNSNNEDKFNIERKITTATGYSYTVWTVGTGITSYTDTSAAANVTYDYRVQACLSGTGCSDYTNLNGVVVPSASGGSTSNTTSYTSQTSLPTAPAGLVASSGNCGINSVSLSWQSATGATGYKIHRNGTLIYTTTNLGYMDTGLTFSTSYSYTVFAFNSLGMSAGVSTTGTTPAPCTASTVTTPSAPTALTVAAVPTGYAIPLRWTDNATNEDKFNIERKLGTATTFSYLTQIMGANITSYIDNTVSPGLSYDYRVQACLSGTGCSGYATLSGVNSSVTSGEVNTQTTTGTTYQNVTTQTTTINGTNTIVTTRVPTTTINSTNVAPFVVNSLPKDTSLATSNYSTTTFAPKNNLDTRFVAPVTKVAPIVPYTPKNVDPSSSTYNLLNIGQGYSSSSPKTIPAQNKPVVVPPKIAKMQNISDAIDNSESAVDAAKLKLVKIVDQNIKNALENASSTNLATSTENAEAIRKELMTKIDSSLEGVSSLTKEKIDTLAEELNRGLKDIHDITRQDQGTSTPSAAVDTNTVSLTLDSLGTTIDNQAKVLKSEGADLLYKDSNKDGISDYDSMHVYNIDPVKPSVVTEYNGTTVTAGEKVLLGYDPKSVELVKVVHEEPAAAPAPVVPLYKVAEVKLTEEKKVVIKGKALPNSFVTIYVYSTPVIVTVKTNSDGEWQYVVDKELDSGEHTVYAATVNNSGKILAKSTGYTFTKTAEAATLNNVSPAVMPVSEVHEPTLFDNITMYIVTLISLVVVFFILFFIGRGLKEGNDNNEIPSIGA